MFFKIQAVNNSGQVLHEMRVPSINGITEIRHDVPICVDGEYWFGWTFAPLLRSIPVQCEHGVDDGNWCEPCNLAYKQGRAEEEPCE